MIEIDGSVLEGGGQVLRMSTVFSCLLCKKLRIFNIRAGRDTPGLRPQHLTGLRLIRDMCQGELEGDRVGSTTVTFTPKVLVPGEYIANTGTAGSVALLIQIALPCAVFAACKGHVRIRMIGGTNVMAAPQIDYIRMVFQPIAEKFNIKMNIDVHRRGLFPKGGGEVDLLIEQHSPDFHLQSIRLTDRGSIERITGYSWVAGTLPQRLCQVIADEVKQHLSQDKTKFDIQTNYEGRNVGGNGCGIVLSAHTSTGCILGSDVLGRRGLKAEDLGREAAENLNADLSTNGCVDKYLQDQLIVLMALATGKSEIKTTCHELTLHTQTAIFIAECFCGVKFDVEQSPDKTSTISVTGIDHRYSS